MSDSTNLRLHTVNISPTGETAIIMTSLSIEDDGVESKKIIANCFTLRREVLSRGFRFIMDGDDSYQRISLATYEVAFRVSLLQALDDLRQELSKRNPEYHLSAPVKVESHDIFNLYFLSQGYDFDTVLKKAEHKIIRDMIDRFKMTPVINRTEL